MNETTQKTESRFLAWFRLCPIRHILSLLGLAVIAAYFALRPRRDVMQALSDRLVRPWHRVMSRLCSHLPFSAAELLIALAVIFGLVYIIVFVVLLIRKPRRLQRIYRFLLT